MKITIAGSRDFKNLVKVGIILKKLEIIYPEMEILTGGAKGVDEHANELAKYRGYKRKVIKPDWKQYGRHAGLMRNKKMVEESDMVVAFWNGKSKGTKNTIGHATKNGKELHVYMDSEE